MAKIRQTPVPPPIEYVFKQRGIKLKKFKTVAAFEKEFKKFVATQHVLHLSTCKESTPRSTPLEYRTQGMNFFILSEGGAKFENLKHNKKISFSIAAPYNSGRTTVATRVCRLLERPGSTAAKTRPKNSWRHSAK